MQFTLEQVAELAPDSSSSAAGKKLMALKNWPELGKSDAALWGKCQGSTVYQVKIDLTNFGYNCNCPSRKFPCKHVLGLLMLVASSPDAVDTVDTPDWVEDWLSKRETRKATKEAKAAEPPKPVDEKAKQKRAAQRETRVNDGVERLDLWLKDLVRGGLASTETKPLTFWDEQARRLVDAQAPGLAARVARLADIPGATKNWPDQLLSELGRLKLLLQAHERIESLAPALQSDIRQIMGWNINQDELLSSGEIIEDQWEIYGQWTDDDGKLKTQRSWAVGRASLRTALLLQFSVAGQPFPDPILPGSSQSGKLIFYPGAFQQRAKFHERTGDIAPIADPIPGHDTIERFLENVTDALAQQPWLAAHGCVLHEVTLAPSDDIWCVRDRTGHGLPLQGSNHWKMLAVTGGHSFDLMGEWDGHHVRPLGMFTAGTFRTP